MEKEIIPVEENAVPKSTGSIVQISSIYVEIPIPKENNETADICLHNFSIRGYAAEMRRKNPKASMPFATKADLNNIGEYLPPMEIPKSRWWRCSECRRKIENSSSTEEATSHSNSCTHSTPLNVPSHSDATMMLSAAQKVPTTQQSEGIRDVDINVPPGHQERIKDAEIGDEAATGDNTGPVELVIDHADASRHEEINVEIGRMITAGYERGPTEQGNNDVTNGEVPRELQQSASVRSAGVPVEANLSSDDGKQTRIKIMPGRVGDATRRKADGSAGNVSSTGDGPIQVEEGGNESTESDQIRKTENSSGVIRRKRKVRYMTELLGDNGNLKHDLPKADASSIHLKLDASSGSGAVSSHGQVPQEDNGKGIKSPQRKRKMPQEEPEGITDLANTGANCSMSRADSERTVTDNAVCSSEPQANASSAVRLQIPNKNDRCNRKAEKSSALVRRKNRQIQVHDRLSSRPGEQSARKSKLKGGDLRTPIPSTLFRSLGTSSAAEKTENHSKNSHSPQAPERETDDCTEIPSQIPKSQSSNLKVGLDLSLNSFAGKNDSSGNKETASTSKSAQEKNDLHFGPCGILPAPERDLSRRSSQAWDLNKRIAQNSTNLVERRDLSPVKEMLCPKDKTSDAGGHSMEINRQRAPMGSNRMAQGPTDDIPMEIVELMAKNQYERGLPDAGNSFFGHRTNTTMGRSSEVQRMGPTTITKGFPALTSFSTANARHGLAMAGNSFNYSQMNRNQFQMCNPERNKVSIFDMFPRNQQILSHGMQYPASASIRTGSQHSQRAEMLSSSTAPNMSFGLGIQQRYPAQNAESHHRGKTISDIKADEMKKSQDARPKRPVDPYGNDNIPAMQLLSLMNGRSSGTQFNISSSKTFAPCGYHPRYSTMDRRDFLSGSMFQRQSRLGAGNFSVGESSGRSSGQRPLAYSGPPEEDQSYLLRYSNCIPSAGHTSSWGKDKQLVNMGASDSLPYLPQHLERRSLSLEDETILEEVQPLRTIPPEEQICVTNRNPAELMLGGTEGKYTIGWKDLKFRKKRYSRESLCDGAKRQRVIKQKAAKEQLQKGALQMFVEQPATHSS